MHMDEKCQHRASDDILKFHFQNMDKIYIDPVSDAQT